MCYILKIVLKIGGPWKGFNLFTKNPWISTKFDGPEAIDIVYNMNPFIRLSHY